MQSITRDLQIKTQSEDLSGRLYVNALSEDSGTFVALLLMAVNRKSNEEKLIDALLPDDRLATVLSVIRQVLGSDWTLLESWEIEPMAPLLEVA